MLNAPPPETAVPMSSAPPITTDSADSASPSHTGAASAHADADGVPLPQRYAAVAAILGALVLVVLDGAIANVALPNIAQRLNASPADTVWVVTAYQLVVVMFLLPASALGEKLGYRRVFMTGVALFTLALALRGEPAGGAAGAAGRARAAAHAGFESPAGSVERGAQRGDVRDLRAGRRSGAGASGGGGALLIAAVVCLTLLVRRELPRAAPLIPLDLLRSPPFRMSIIASVCCFTGQMASYVALPFYMHHAVRGGGGLPGAWAGAVRGLADAGGCQAAAGGVHHARGAGRGPPRRARQSPPVPVASNAPSGVTPHPTRPFTNCSVRRLVLDRRCCLVQVAPPSRVAYISEPPEAQPRRLSRKVMVATYRDCWGLE
ncbi:major facilitator superfamily domain-containing protein [Ditylenchus destructor]|nr:major facilitator superfamily domain-containing protein [Ditylenchus destructor]